MLENLLTINAKTFDKQENKSSYRRLECSASLKTVRMNADFENEEKKTWKKKNLPGEKTIKDSRRDSITTVHQFFEKYRKVRLSSVYYKKNPDDAGQDCTIAQCGT